MSNGHICCCNFALLKNEWSPALDVKKVLTSLAALLKNPGLGDTCHGKANIEMIERYKKNKFTE